MVPASDYRALQNQVRELHRLLGKKTLEAEILKGRLPLENGVDPPIAVGRQLGDDRLDLGHQFVVR